MAPLYLDPLTCLNSLPILLGVHLLACFLAQVSSQIDCKDLNVKIEPCIYEINKFKSIYYN